MPTDSVLGTSLSESLVRLREKLEQEQRVNFAEIQRRSGLASRSYVRQVLLGKKQPSLSALRAILSAMKVPARTRRQLELQLEMSLAPSGKIKNELKQQLELTQRKSKILRDSGLAQRTYGSLTLPWVYCALGSEELGASLKDLQKRTSLPEAAVEKSLKLLMENGLCLFKEGRYYASDQHLVFEKNGAPSYKEFFLKSIERSLQKARIDFRSADYLFSTQMLCVRRKQLPDLQEKLWNLLTEFVRENEDPSGDQVISLSSLLTD